MVERRVDKPWGCEVIWAETEEYAGKLLFIKKGHKLSLQYHEKKRESFVVDRGRLKFHWKEEGDSTLRAVVMVVGDHFDIPPGMVHRMEAIDDCCLIEVSTPELDDVVRLEDDYSRI